MHMNTYQTIAIHFSVLRCMQLAFPLAEHSLRHTAKTRKRVRGGRLVSLAGGGQAFGDSPRRRCTSEV